MPRKFEFFDRVKRPEIKYPENNEDYIDYETKIVKRSTGPGEDDFELEEKIIEKKTNIKKFINSFANDVGIHNIIKKIKQTGDVSLINQIEVVHADTTVIPDDPEEAFAQSQAIKEAYEKIDPSLRGTLTPEQFIQSMTPEKIQAYIDGKVSEALAKVNPTTKTTEGGNE